MPTLIGSKLPLVSVIVCVYNAGRYLRPSIESLLAQTYENLEIIIVNDGSSDGCMESIADLCDKRIRIINQENRGKPAAMNVGLDAMRGEFYALQDADDLSHPNRIERQLACMLAHPQVAAVFCGHDLIIDGRQLAPTSQSKDPERCRSEIARCRMPEHDPTAMYRWSLVKELRYEEDLPIVEGFDYVLRVGERHPMMVVGECLYSYRIHMRSVTKQSPQRRNKLVCEVLRRACARRGWDYQTHFPAAHRCGRRHRDLDNNIAAQFMASVCDQRRQGRSRQSVTTGIECFRLHPFDPHYYKALFYAIFPRWLIRRIRRNSYCL